MKFRTPKFARHFLNNLGGLLASAAVRYWMDTLEYKCAYYEESVDPAKPGYAGQKIYIFWHEYILFPLYLRGHNNLTMLLSRHRDTDILSRTAYHMGFEFVRGSSTRGGMAALRELVRRSRNMNLTITPDGPTGPRRTLASGPIYLASKLGLPIVAMGYGYDRPWRMRTWDHHAVPRPFSRARAVVSPAIHVPAELNREGLEHYRLQVERLMNRLTLEAEAWAESGTHKVEEVPLRREPMWREYPRLDPKHIPPQPHFSSLPEKVLNQITRDERG
ncbi:MAG TPA: lysophospholipid acyltransferase family protein [Pirellulales bacterium]|nr:lysophospholipid acyltransferase family protein [Pirellulales bacterium]